MMQNGLARRPVRRTLCAARLVPCGVSAVLGGPDETEGWGPHSGCTPDEGGDPLNSLSFSSVEVASS